MLKPSEVKDEAQKLEDQNYQFRRFLKGRADADKLDAQFLSLHEELFADYDCNECANCCRSYGTIISSDEMKRIAAHLGLPESDFIAKYLIQAEPDEDLPYEFKDKPCLFLHDDGSCRIQECQPEVCAAFPFTDRPDRLSSMLSIIGHAEVCPVVFEILERLKVLYGFRNRL